MSSFDRLNRRDFLGRTLKLGAAGFAASCTVSSCTSAIVGPATDGPWQIGCYTRPWADYDYTLSLSTKEVKEGVYREKVGEFIEAFKASEYGIE